MIFRVLMVMSLALFSQMNWGESAFKLSSTLNQTRFFNLIEELRCPKCQNQNLADSESEIAKDLRKQVVNMIEAGKTDQEILAYMVARYGEFVLYRPVYKPATWLLWYGPFILLGFGVLMFALVVIGNKKRLQQDQEGPC